MLRTILWIALGAILMYAYMTPARNIRHELNSTLESAAKAVR